MPAVAAEIPLAPLTTLRLGGPAERFVAAGTERELIDVVREADAAGEECFVLAGGSNVVIADAGLRGTVLHVVSRGIERRSLGDGRIALSVAAGEPWDEVVAGAVADGLAGIECLSGIPGSTGATPIQNVGAYGQEVSTTITRVRAFDRERDEVVELGPDRCGFAYRTSRFKRRSRHLVLAAAFELSARADSEPIRYAELARSLGIEVGDRAPLAEVREAVIALRRAKSMVVDPDDPNSVSAGSFFTNPILESPAYADLERLVERRFGAGTTPPHWPEPDGRVKVSAAWLIERAGFVRGYGSGRVGLSENHTLAIVNRGGASTDELVGLAREIAARVAERFGIELAPEPIFAGHRW